MQDNLAELGKRGIMCGSQGSKSPPRSNRQSPSLAGDEPWPPSPTVMKRVHDEESQRRPVAANLRALVNDVAGVKPVEPAPAESPAEQGRGTGRARGPSNAWAHP